MLPQPTSKRWARKSAPGCRRSRGSSWNGKSSAWACMPTARTKKPSATAWLPTTLTRTHRGLQVKALHVAVLMGGWSAEREVSLMSGAGIAEALESLGHKVTRIDMDSDVGLKMDGAR